MAAESCNLVGPSVEYFGNLLALDLTCVRGLVLRPRKYLLKSLLYFV